MAINDMRDHGVRPLTPSDVAGSVGMDGRGVNLPTSTYDNPGPTSNIRGIEPNTDLMSGRMDPTYQVNVAGELPVSAVLSPPFQVPQDALGDVDGDSPDGWTTADSSSQNSAMPEPQVGSFTKFGEKYPGFGEPDNDAG